MAFIFPYIGNVIIPTDELHFSEGLFYHQPDGVDPQIQGKIQIVSHTLRMNSGKIVGRSEATTRSELGMETGASRDGSSAGHTSWGISNLWELKKRVDLTCEKSVKRGIEPVEHVEMKDVRNMGTARQKLSSNLKNHSPLLSIVIHYSRIHHSPFTIYLFWGCVKHGQLRSRWPMTSHDDAVAWHNFLSAVHGECLVSTCIHQRLPLFWGSKIQTASKPILALYIPIFLDFRVAAIPSRIGLQHHSPQESAENSSSMVYGCSASLLPTAESGEGLTCSNHPESRTELLETMARAMKYHRVQWIFVLWIQGLKVWDPLKKARHPNAAKCKLMPRVPFARGTTRWGPLDS